jgi:hypothetical protein
MGEVTFIFLRQPFADNLAVGHPADQPVVLSNRNGAYIMLTLQFREFGDAPDLVRCQRVETRGVPYVTR